LPILSKVRDLLSRKKGDKLIKKIVIKYNLNSKDLKVIVFY